MRLLSVALAVVLSSCGPDVQSPRLTGRSTAALDAAFSSAAREYQVPEEVLKGIGWVETRWSTQAGLISASGGVGLMQLSHRAGADVLAEAAQRTGVTEGRLQVDPAANIRGAAAVLRARFDASSASHPELDARRSGDWYLAVSLYPEIDSATGALAYASDVFLALEQGFASQAPTTSGWRQYAPQASTRVDAVQEYPGAAAWAASPNFSTGRTSYEFVLIHTMQGSYAGTRSWFQNTASGVSSHYIVRSSDGQITQMVEHANTAWHAQCYNARSIGIEHEGYIADPATWYTDAMYSESAKLTRWIADRHGIPKDRTHIIGHNEVAPSCNTNGHTDPGSGWNWTKYMQLVNGSGPTGATGVFIGAIYTGGSTSNRVAGATVTVGTQSVTTGSDGLYQFSLAPGAYTATVSKAGYGPNQVTRTVTANAQIWGSMEINPSAATGTLSGTVYAFDAAHPNDTSQLLSGVTVTVGTQSVTTAADGRFSFTLPPGTVTVQAMKSGYETNQATYTVTAGQTTSAQLGLAPQGGADTMPPVVTLAAPVDGVTLDLGLIDVQGTASDDRGPVASVKLSLNGGAEQDVPVTQGAFDVQVLLAPGSNVLSVRAVDAANNAASASATVTFAAGVSGLVQSTEGPLADATVELHEAASGALVSSATSGADGTYFVAAMDVPADYLLVVKKAHFLTSSQTVTAPEDAQLKLDVTLQPGDDVPAQAQLTFVEPADGATVNTDTVTVYGSVTGFDVTQVKVNDVTAELLGAGGFTAVVPLAVGANTLTAVATGSTGQTVSAVLHLTRKQSTAGMSLTDARGGCGGCSTGAGLEGVLLALALALASRRRRR